MTPPAATRWARAAGCRWRPTSPGSTSWSTVCSSTPARRSCSSPATSWPSSRRAASSSTCRATRGWVSAGPGPPRSRTRCSPWAAASTTTPWTTALRCCGTRPPGRSARPCCRTWKPCSAAPSRSAMASSRTRTSCPSSTARRSTPTHGSIRHNETACPAACPSGPSEVGKDAVKRPGDLGEIERAHHQPRVQALPAGPGPHEPVELLLRALPLPRGHLPEDAQRPELALRADDPLDRGHAEGPDQLLLQIGAADVEAERLHVGAGQGGAHAGPLQGPPEVAFLGGVAQAGQPDAEPVGAEQVQEVADVGRAVQVHDGDALRVERNAPPPGQRLERDPVAHPLDDDDRPRPGGGGQIEVHDLLHSIGIRPAVTIRQARAACARPRSAGTRRPAPG